VSTDGSIENLKARISLIIQEVEAIESALMLVVDRVDAAIVATAHTGEDSASDHVATALSSLGRVKGEIEQQVAAALDAREALTFYRESR
jgi:antitoxin (DNA-binding transcriptional repressor) of toxin-antitoxin stability system